MTPDGFHLRFAEAVAAAKRATENDAEISALWDAVEAAAEILDVDLDAIDPPDVC